MWDTRRGIGLVEVIVVLGILALMMGLLLPAVQSARSVATRADCQNRLHQIGLAIQNYESSHGFFPPRAGFEGRNGKPPTAMEMLNWMPFILPMIEQDSLWATTVSACQVEPLPFISPPHLGFSSPVKQFICPADPRLLAPVPIEISGTIHLTSDVAMTSFIGSGGVWIFPVTANNTGPAPGAFGNGKVTGFADITDGTSQTIMVGERPPPDTYQAGQWYQAGWQFGVQFGPDGVLDYLSPSASDTCAAGALAVFGPGRLSNPCDRYHYWSLHRGGANFLFCDGSVHFLTYTAKSVLPELITRASGDIGEVP